ncbi:MAG: DUF3341 domain-containing protein [Acidobacteria bacterium]|nr:DUF3341 domain-containing protein [Acidobacteriota bacterium]
MSKQWMFDEKADFLAKLRELVDGGVDPHDLETMTPFPVHEADHILHTRTSRLRFFTLAGTLTGLIAGFAFTIFTVMDWPLITGGKPLISLPPFLVIAFELTILLGGILSFVGFLALARLPSVKNVLQPPKEYGNRFVIQQRGEE